MFLRFAAAAIVFTLLIFLAYFLVPTDLYHPATPLSNFVNGAAAFLVAHRLRFFPAALVFLFAGQKFLGLCRFLENAYFLPFFLLIPLVARKFPARKFAIILVLSGLVTAGEIAAHLLNYDFSGVLLTPMLVFGIFLKSTNYFWVMATVGLIFTFRLWSEYLEDFVSNSLYLFFIPLAVFEKINLLLLSLGVAAFFNFKKLLRCLPFFYLLLIFIFVQFDRGQWIWTKENRNNQYLIFEKEFFLPAPALFRASAKITAKSAYKLYINDQFAGLGPGPIDNQNRYFDENNVTAKLLPGKNIIRIIAYNFGHDTHFQTKQTGGLFFQLALTAGPLTFLLPADRTWSVQIKYYEDLAGVTVQEDNFSLPANGEFTHEVFGRRGGRYLEITADPRAVKQTNVYINNVRFPAEKIGDFTGGEELTGIYALGENTLRLAMQDQFEDSFVHERSQYLGDSYVDMLAGFYSLNPQPLSKKALYQFAQSQQPDGLIKTVYPSGLNQTILSYNLEFSSFLKDYFLYTGDRKTLNDLLPAATKINLAFEKMIQNGLVNPDRLTDLKPGDQLTGFVDWVNTDAYGDPAPDTFLVINCQYLQQLDALAYFYNFTDPAAAKNFLEKAAAFRRNFRDFILRKDFAAIEEHAAVAIINANVLTNEENTRLYNLVLKNPAKPLVTGYFNLFYLEAMEKIGDAAGIKNLLDQHWGGMLRNGAVTTWESFDPRSQKLITASKTHTWSAGPTYFLPAFVAGLRPLSPGFKSVAVEPVFLANNISLNLNTPAGTIALQENKLPSGWRISLTKSAPVEIQFRLPFTAGTVQSFTVNGQQIEPQFVDNKLVYTTTENQINLEITSQFL